MTRAAALALIAAIALAGCTADTTKKAKASAQTRPTEAPQLVRDKCEERFGETAKIETVSPLREGFYEVIMGSFKGPRRAACTANVSGEIVDWVDL